MSQRNRIVFATFILMVALFLAAPPPSRAAALRPNKAPAFNVWERAWNWLATLLPDGVAAKSVAGLEKEGGAINPDGRPNITAPAPGTAQSDEGSVIKPDGAK